MEKEKKEFLQKEQDLKAEIEKLCEKGRRYFKVPAAGLFRKLITKGAAGHGYRQAEQGGDGTATRPTVLPQAFGVSNSGGPQYLVEAAQIQPAGPPSHLCMFANLQH